jgi:hypothetical protein
MTTTLLDPPLTEPAPPKARRDVPAIEIAVAVGAFILFCVAVLTKATRLLEPDDAAYLASIIALAHGHLTLTTAQYDALSTQMQTHYGMGIEQWVHLPDGRWISEKNPGYPFFAVIFYWLGILRAAPLFAGALASTSLFVAGRRWLGRWGGVWAVILFLSSGAALAFAWRPTMPSFTDASLVAAGAGALLWTFIAVDASARRRTVVGLLGFVALEAAVAVRYTDIVMLGVAAVAVVCLHRRAGIATRSLVWWFGSLAVFATVVATFDAVFYGGPFKTGYGAGEITFSTSAILPNLKLMPSHLLASMPVLVVGLAALVWMGAKVVRSRRHPADTQTATRVRRDALVGLVLAAGWLGIWGLYSAYTWTAQMGAGGPAGGGRLGRGVAHVIGGGGGGGAIHVIRFYLPAIGLIALLGAWLLAQLPRWLPPVVLVAIAGLGLWSFESLTAVGALGGPGGGFPGGLGGRPGGPRGRFPPGSKLPAGGRPPSGGGFQPGGGAPPGGGPP